jgi:hypothetical protein
MMGRQERDQMNLFYEFRHDDIVPKSHLLRRLDIMSTIALRDLHAIVRVCVRPVNAHLEVKNLTGHRLQAAITANTRQMQALWRCTRRFSWRSADLQHGC